MYTFFPQTYKKSTSVVDTFHGTDYQITVLAWYAIDYLINKTEDYELYTEPADIEKFDDIVLFTRNKKEFIQVKHSKDPDGTYEINDLANQKKEGKKVQLYIYFDQWLRLRESYGSTETINFIIYSNHTLSQKKGLHECVDPETGKFISLFIENNPIEIKGNITKPPKEYNKKQRILWHSNHLFQSILKASIKLKNSSDEPQNKINLIRQFLREFSFKLGMPNVDKLSEHVNFKLRSYYKINNDAIANALYIKVKNWLRKENVKTLTANTMRKFLNQEHAQVNVLQRWVGLTKRRLDILPSLINGHTLERDDVVDVLNNWLNNNVLQIFILHGEPGIGKSNIIKLFIQSQHYFKDGDYIFLELAELNDNDLSFLKSMDLKVLIIDDVEMIFQPEKKILLNKLLAQLGIHKLIIVTQDKGLLEIKKHLKSHKFYNLVEHSVKPLPHNKILSLLPPNLSNLPKNNPLWSLIKIPFYLNLVCKKADSLRVEHLPLNNLTNYIIKLAIRGENSQRTGNVISGKKRQKFLEKLLYKIYQEQSRSVVLTKINTDILNVLVQENILLQNLDNSIEFSHSIYKNWILNKLAKKIACEAVDECHSALFIFKRIAHAFAQDIYSCIEILDENSDLTRFLTEKLRTKSEQFPSLFSDFPRQICFHKHVILQAIRLNKNKILKKVLNGDINLDEPLNENFITYVAIAIDLGNYKAISTLFKYGADPVCPRANEFRTDSYYVEDISDDPPDGYSTDEEDNSFNDMNSEDEGEFYYYCRKDHFRLSRYNRLRTNRIEDGLGYANDSEPFNLENERLSKAPYLIRVAYRGNVELLDLFWEKGDEPPLNLYKETPLHIAILQKKVDMVKALLSSYHPIELQDYEGETALHNAIYTKNKEIFDLLISYYTKNKSLNINVQNNVGWTPLHLAILQGNQYMIDKLINLAADLYIKSNAGNSSIQLCKQINNFENLNLKLGDNLNLEEVSDESNDEIDSNSSEYQDISDSEDDNLFQPKIIEKGII